MPGGVDTTRVAPWYDTGPLKMRLPASVFVKPPAPSTLPDTIAVTAAGETPSWPVPDVKVIVRVAGRVIVPVFEPGSTVSRPPCAIVTSLSTLPRLKSWLIPKTPPEIVIGPE